MKGWKLGLKWKEIKTRTTRKLNFYLWITLVMTILFYIINSYQKILENSIRFYKISKMRTDPILISTIFNDQLEKLVYKKPIVKPLTAKTTKSIVNCKTRIINIFKIYCKNG